MIRFNGDTALSDAVFHPIVFLFVTVGSRLGGFILLPAAIGAALGRIESFGGKFDLLEARKLKFTPALDTD
jgi:hypothetical protein